MLKIAIIVVCGIAIYCWVCHKVGQFIGFNNLDEDETETDYTDIH